MDIVSCQKQTNEKTQGMKLGGSILEGFAGLEGGKLGGRFIHISLYAYMKFSKVKKII